MRQSGKPEKYVGYLHKEILPGIQKFFVQKWTINGFNKLLMGLTNTDLGRGRVWREILLSPFFQEGTTQEEIYNLTVEAWISLDSSNLSCTIYTFSKLVLLKELRLSSHSCRVKGFSSILFVAVFLVPITVPGDKHL